MKRISKYLVERRYTSYKAFHRAFKQYVSSIQWWYGDDHAWVIVYKEEL